MAISGHSMQGIAQHGSGWRYRWTEPVSGKRQLSPTLPVEDAKQFRMWVLAQHRKVADNDPRILSGEWKYQPLASGDGTKTWGEQAAEWLREQKAEARSVRNYGQAIARSVAIHDVPIQDLDTDALRDFQIGLGELKKLKLIKGAYVEQSEPRYAATTIQSTMIAVRAIIKDAASKGVILEDPSITFTPDKAERVREHRYLTTDEYQALRRCADTDQVRVMLDLMAYAGLRLGEMLGLRVSRLYLDAPTPYIRIDLTTHVDGTTDLPKGSRRMERKRNVAINADLVSGLKAYLDARGDQGRVDWLFLSPMRPTTFISHNWGAGDQGPWQRAVSEAVRQGLLSLREGLPTPHDLRHSHASWLLNEGVPLIKVSKRLGHKNVIVTATVYAHLLDMLDDDSANVIQKLFGAPASAQPAPDVEALPARKLAIVRQ